MGIPQIDGFDFGDGWQKGGTPWYLAWWLCNYADSGYGNI